MMNIIKDASVSTNENIPTITNKCSVINQNKLKFYVVGGELII